MSPRLYSDRLADYLGELVPPRPTEMQIMEAYAKKTGFPIIGPVAGHACYQYARMIGASRVFELGSGYGYSTAWFAKAVQENGGGEVHHAVWSKELSDKARKHLGVLGYGEIIKYHVSEAVQALDGTPGSFDLIFNDIDKEGYADSLPTITRKLRPGGVLIVDNVLWSGRVYDESDRSRSTESIRQLTRKVMQEPNWISSVIPLRDGLLVAIKTG
jgi:caffeoyl-CoA O-methyltransferase